MNVRRLISGRRSRLGTTAAWLLCAVTLLFPLILNGCGIIERVTGEAARKNAQVEKAKEESQILQLQVMRFSDEYVENMSRRSSQLVEDYAKQAEATPVEIDRLRVQVASEQFVQATAAFQIAAGTNPVANAVDMVVLASLSRRIVEEVWLPRYGDAVKPLLRAYRSLEEDAWHLVDGVATEEKRTEFREVLRAYYDKNPGLQSGAFVRFNDIASIGGGKKEIGVSPGLLGMVGLDPMAGFDPAIREVERSRILAERALFYAQRVPVLLDFQATELLTRMGQSDYSRETLQTITQVGRLSESLNTLMSDLPSTVAREREAAISQFMNELQSQQDEVLALTQQLREVLEAGNVTAQSLDGLVNSTDRLMARFEPDPDAPKSTEPPRPFDITDYTAAIMELAATAREFQALVQDVDTLVPQALEGTDQLTERARELIDYAFSRLLLLILAVFVAAIAYRLVAGRQKRATANARTG